MSDRDQHTHGHEHDDERHGAAHFDERAATWDDDPSHVERAEAIAAGIAARVALTESTRWFEYGAGTGSLSAALAAHVGSVTLADTSAGMREVIATKIEAGLLPAATVWDLDLSTQPPPVGAGFDVIATAMTLHHLTDLGTALGAFAELLEPGGSLCIADLDEEDGSFHGDGFAGHHGFNRGALTADLETAGFADVTFTDCHHVNRDGVIYPIFLAIARRADRRSA